MLRFKNPLFDIKKLSGVVHKTVFVRRCASFEAFQFDVNNPISINELNTSSVPKVLPNIETTDTWVINACSTPITVKRTYDFERKPTPLWERILKKKYTKPLLNILALDSLLWAITYNNTSSLTIKLFNDFTIFVGVSSALLLSTIIHDVCSFPDIKKTNDIFYTSESNEKYDKPIFVIDDWIAQAPYLRILSILKHHTNIILSSVNSNISLEKNYGILYNVKQFVTNTDDVPGLKPYYKHCDILNMQYLKYLNLEQRTRMIDWYVDKYVGIYQHPESKGVIITSINYDLDKLYDETHGTNKIAHIEKLHKEYTGECYYGKQIIDDVTDQTMYMDGVQIFTEAEINREKSRVVLVDFLDEYFDLTNPSNNAIRKKLNSFGKSNIVAVYDPMGKMKHIVGKSRDYVMGIHGKNLREMLFIENSSYISCCVDNLIFSMSRDQNQDQKYATFVTFIDPRLKKLYKGKYSIVELDVEKEKVDYLSIKIMDTQAFSDGYNYAITNDEKYSCYNHSDDDAIEWCRGNIYANLHYDNTREISYK